MVRNRHGLCKACNFIQTGPQGFQDFTFDLSSALNKIERKFCKAVWNVGGKMPLPDGAGNVQRIPQFQEFRFGYTLFEVNTPLAAYVVNNQGLYMSWESFQSLADRVVDINLPIAELVLPSFPLGRICAPLPFLKIYNTVWYECTMSCTCACTFPRRVQMFPMHISIILSPVIAASRFLHSFQHIFIL